MRYLAPASPRDLTPARGALPECCTARLMHLSEGTELARQLMTAVGAVTEASRQPQSRCWVASLARSRQAFAYCCRVVLSIALLPLPTWADTTHGEIVMTAQRQQENAQDVPIAITAFTATDPERGRVCQAGDITNVVPNLILASPYKTEA